MSKQLTSNATELIENQGASSQILKNLNDLSVKFSKNIIVEQVKQSSNKNTIFDLFKNEIKDISLPYPDIDEIPLIKIKDENHFEFGGEIEFFNNYDDNKYNKCKICKNKNNIFYCKDCHKNECENCYNYCKEQNHHLINLQEEKKEIEILKLEIYNILLNFDIRQIKENQFNFSEGNDINFNNQKFDKNNFDNSITNMFNYNNDIIFIDLTVKKNYINYFHFQNIKEFYKYLNNSYLYKYNKDCLKIEYNINNFKGEHFKIFGHTFVENNKDKVYLRINGKECELVETINIKDDYLDAILIQKSMKEEKNYIDNMSCIFCDCKSTEIKITKVKSGKLLDLSHVTDISNMFKNCSNLKTIDLNFLENATNIIYMDSIFNGCKKLEKILNIDKLDTKSVINMNNIFNDCEEIKDLNGINNFKTNKVEYIKRMFKGCTSLVNLPDISKWEVENVKSMKGMFKECISLKSLPDISNWDVKKVKNMKGLFKGCKSLNSLPDISNWDVKNVKNMQGIFEGCASLKSLPDISQWNVGNVKNMKRMFKGCLNIINLPNLKNWKLLNLKNIDEIFLKCKTLLDSKKTLKIQDLLNIENIEIISSNNAIEED